MDCSFAYGQWWRDDSLADSPNMARVQKDDLIETLLPLGLILWWDRKEGSTASGIVPRVEPT